MSYEVELLAPAGNETALHAAVRAGADAVYLGLGAFNARRGADNFTEESFARACEYAHMRGVSIYVTLNTEILPLEVDDALEAARQAYRFGADAFIVQDIGIAAELTRTLPQARLHISTQMNTHNEAGIEAAARLGAKRITLARELSLAEIANLAHAAAERGMEVEAFAHGALCICYSGQCFMSSLIGGRSANRGMCAQACRLPYTLRNGKTGKDLPAPGDHLLSPQDLSSIDVLPDLVRAGVSSLKIEGRMKSPEYVFAVVSAYRSALDRALSACRSSECPGTACTCGANEASVPVEDAPAAAGVTPDSTAGTAPDPASSYQATEGEHRALAEAFSRGFTTAYLEGRRGNDIMSYGRPNNRGVFIGRVTSVKNGVAAVSVDCPLVVGDVVEFWTNRGHFACTVREVRSDRRGNVLLSPDRPVGKGDRVFRVRSAEAAFEDDDREPRVAVEGFARLRIGEPLVVGFRLAPSPANARLARAIGRRTVDVDGVGTPQGSEGEAPESPASILRSMSASVEGDVVEAARTRAVSQADVRDHIDRLGQTPFFLASLEVDMDEGVGIGFSKLHHARAAALDALRSAIVAPTVERRLPRIDRRPAIVPARPHGVTIAALATNPACARAAKRAGADVLYVPALNRIAGESSLAGVRLESPDPLAYPSQCVTVLPAVEHDPVKGTREDRLGLDAWDYVRSGEPVVAESLGDLVRAADRGFEVEVGPHIPLTNALSLEVAYSLGARRAWLSPELTLAQIRGIAKASPLELGLTIIGHQELMVTEHCLLMSQGPCAEQCDTCPRRRAPHFLKDRKDYEFPVVTDALGRSHLYNAVMLDVAHEVPELVSAGISLLMVDTTLMTASQAGEAVARAVRARSLAHVSGGSVAKAEGTTSGHLFRGVA